MPGGPQMVERRYNPGEIHTGNAFGEKAPGCLVPQKSGHGGGHADGENHGGWQGQQQQSVELEAIATASLPDQFVEQGLRRELDLAVEVDVQVFERDA